MDDGGGRATVPVTAHRSAYVDWGGRGGTMLFVPGGCDTGLVFGDVAPAFTDTFRVVGMMPRGCGRGPHEAGDYGIDAQVDDIAAVVDEFGAARTVLVGHSTGAAKMIRFARRYPASVTALVCLETMYRYIAPGLERLMGAAISARVGSDPTQCLDRLRRYEQVLELGAWSDARERNLQEVFEVQPDGRVRPAVSIEWQRAFAADIRAGRYDGTAIAHPALMIFATRVGYERARQFGAAHVAAMAQLLDRTEAERERQIAEFEGNGPHIRILKLSGTGHYCFVDRREAVIEAMRRFLTPDHVARESCERGMS